ncbi:MAG: alpha/beta hydrolase [Clostridia bacterium]|nr:alpha/beta hydrolase [Clostridia bacterium]
MKKLRYLICVLLAAFVSLVAVACGDDEQEEERIPIMAGTSTIEITHHGRAVEADAYIPDTGSYSIVIFSHGYNGSKNDFQANAKALVKNNIAAITFTFCGSGERDKSTLATTDMTLFTEKEDLIAVIDYAQRLEGFDGNLFLVGGSQGGMVSAMAAEERADDIAGMVLLYAGFCIPDDWNARYPDDATVPEIIPWWGVNLGRNFVLSLRNLDIYKNMANFTKPVLLMHAADDNIVPLSYSERAAEAYPNAKLTRRNAGGHGFLPADGELLKFIEDCIFD